MRDFIQKYWTPAAGAISSISWKGITDLSQSPEVAEIAEEAVKHEPTLISFRERFPLFCPFAPVPCSLFSLHVKSFRCGG